MELNARLNYRHSRNELNPATGYDTYHYDFGTRIQVRLPWRMTVETDASLQSRRGYDDRTMNTDELVWNARIAQDFLPKNAATLSLRPSAPGSASASAPQGAATRGVSRCTVMSCCSSPIASMCSREDSTGRERAADPAQAAPVPAEAGTGAGQASLGGRKKRSRSFRQCGLLA